MSHEIYYTSAPEGIKRGTSGFCTVAASDNIPKPLWDRLETLSAYRHHFSTGGQANPVSFAHWILAIAGKTHHVLSRICDSGVDHTQRTNAFAHHLVLDPAEIAAAAGGPAWLLQQPGVMMERWNGQVGSLTPSSLARGDNTGSRICHQWAAVTGDAGWGGHLADVFAKSPTKPVCILFAPGQELLPLLAETIALLPSAARWNVTFNTYFTSMPTSATCLWRCCLAGTPAAQIGLRYAASGIVLDLTDRARLPALPACDYVTMARTGQSATAVRAPLGIKPAQPALAELKRAGPGAKTSVPPRPVYDPIGDEEERETQRRRDSAFEFAMPAEQPTPAPAAVGEYDLRQTEPAQPNTRDRQRGVSVPPSRLIRRADEALADDQLQADRAATSRRRQVLLMFFGALAALGAGSALIFYLSARGGPPPEPPATTRNVHPHSVDASPAVQAPTPQNVPPTLTQTTSPNTSQPIAIQTQPVQTSPEVATSAPTFPEIVTLAAALTRPDPGTGIGDRVQSLPFKASDLDPGAVTAVRLAFFSQQPDQATPLPPINAPTSFRDETLGILTAVSGNANGKKGVSLYWKQSSEPGLGTEFAFIGLDRAKPALEFQWHAAPLLRNSGVYNYIFWVLQHSSFVLEGSRSQPQQVILKPFAPGPLNFTDPAMQLTWPTDLPRDVRAVEPPPETLPSGWKADWILDWDNSLPAAARSPANGYQVISFKKPTSNPKIDAWFVLTFRAGASGGIARLECTFARQFQQAKDDLAKAENDLADITRKIDSLKNDPAFTTFGGGIPPDMISRQTECTTLRDAYKAAVAGYNELSAFDVSFDLSDKMRLATLHFQRPAAQ